MVFTGLIDSGSNCNLISAGILPDDFLALIRRPTASIKGVGGDRDAIGEFYAQVRINQSTFNHVRFIVVESLTCPTIIGLPIWDHPSVEDVMFNHKSNKIVLNRTSGNSEIVEFFKSWDTSPQIPTVRDSAFNVQVDPTKLSSTKERVDWIKVNLGMDLEWPNENELDAMARLVIEFRHVFGSDDEDMGEFPTPCRIKVDPKRGPYSVNVRQVPLERQKYLDAEIDKMLRLGIIEKCPDSRGWNSPIVMVEKSDGSWRPCANFKPTLNKCLVEEEAWSQFSCDELFNRVQPNSKYFSTMDILKAFWQITIEPSDRYLTAFQVPGRFERYQFVRLPFGMKTSGNIFSHAVAQALATQSLNLAYILTYLDDLSIIGPDFNVFLDSHRQVFTALSKFNLKLKSSKCHLLKKQISFIGRCIDEKGMRPDPKYIEGIMEIAPPKNRPELRHLIGTLCWVRAFIKANMGDRVSLNSFSHLMYPINQCNRDGPFLWTSEAQKSFDRIKKKLSSAPFISVFDPVLPVVLTCDASDVACGVMLMQCASENDYRVVAALSHTFNKTERNWSTTEKECFAIVYALRKLDFYLRGRAFEIFTDHKSLTYIDTVEFRNSKCARWQDEVSNYNFTINYIAGQSNVWADWLSRPSAKVTRRVEEKDLSPKGVLYSIPGTTYRVYVPSWCLDDITTKDGKVALSPVDLSNPKCHFSGENNILAGPAAFMSRREIHPDYEIYQHLEVANKQREDSFLCSIIQWFESIKRPKPSVVDVMDKKDHRFGTFKSLAGRLFLDAGSGLLCLHGKRPQIIVPDKLIARFVKSAHDLSGHPGVEGTLARLVMFFWIDKRRDVDIYVKSCQSCVTRKGTWGQLPVTAGTNKKGSRPFSVIYMDYVTMPSSGGFRYLLTVVDSFSRFIDVFPLRTNTATDTAQCLAEYYNRHGELPTEISSDRGRHFIGEVFQSFCKQFGVKSSLHCTYRPQSSGILERVHRHLKNSIFIVAKEMSKSWPSVLSHVVACINGTPKAVLNGRSPFEVIRGKKFSTLGLPVVNDTCAANVDEFVKKQSKFLTRTHELVALCNAAADKKHLAKNNSRPTRPQFDIGDIVCLHDPLSNKHTVNVWKGRYKVLDTLDTLVSKLMCMDTNKVDWYSNHRLQLLPVRPPHLNQDDSDSEDEFSLPRPPENSIRRMTKPVTRTQTQNKTSDSSNLVPDQSVQESPSDSAPEVVSESVPISSKSVSTPHDDSRRGGDIVDITEESPVQSTLEQPVQHAPEKKKYKNPRLPSIPSRPPSMRLLAMKLNQDASHVDKPD